VGTFSAGGASARLGATPNSVPFGVAAMANRAASGVKPAVPVRFNRNVLCKGIPNGPLQAG
jgi:hypothetical protein